MITMTDEELKIPTFKDKDLMINLSKEFSKTHIGDSIGPLLTFVTICSSRLKPEYRNSLSVRGESSEGKSNMVKSVCFHLPKIQPNPKAIEAHISQEIFATHATLRLIKQGIPYKMAYKAIAEKLRKGEPLDPLPIITDNDDSKEMKDLIAKNLSLRKDKFQKSITQIIDLVQKILDS